MMLRGALCCACAGFDQPRAGFVLRKGLVAFFG
jgi:hypothetical protein